ncbi:DUF554 domain-containing protein [Candidatus Sulfidibacterium hydrothermale]|uniref:DUF554 domain-containing protein n=1 Tax=Candidatus Sulfidibacterium hydrothermale TaxID=2875962 RepID=UPI001F0B43A4|nr:DUF554 domain-containing protein [Candidatus Sulfidibacterium hydrothermale]UBM61798.1 DUF554 domain-containing protein [Candidatus Sulfidibacterium hydrothermale]
MIGTLVNVATVIVGSLTGLLLKSRLPDRFIKIFFQVIGLFTLYLGVSMALKSTHVLQMVFSLIIGAVIGESLHLDRGLEKMADVIKKRFKSKNERFTDGLLTAFLLYCMGSLTILGAIEEGMNGDPHLLLIKSLMDGVSSIALASGLGIGVLFSAVPLLIFQGGITLLAMWLGDFFPAVMITELSAVGGILLLGLGIDILGIKKIKVINMLPALVVIVFLIWLFPGTGV